MLLSNEIPPDLVKIILVFLFFDNLQQNVCDVMKEYFTKNKHGKNTKNEELSVKLPLIKTEFGRKGLYFLAAKEYHNLSLQARKIES